MTSDLNQLSFGQGIEDALQAEGDLGIAHPAHGRRGRVVGQDHAESDLDVGAAIGSGDQPHPVITDDAAKFTDSMIAPNRIGISRTLKPN